MQYVGKAAQKLNARFNGCRTVFKHPDKYTFVKTFLGISVEVTAKLLLLMNKYYKRQKAIEERLQMSWILDALSLESNVRSTGC